MIGSSRVSDLGSPLAISIPRTGAAVIRHFQECMLCSPSYTTPSK
jgi:hypothetical protein